MRKQCLMVRMKNRYHKNNQKKTWYNKIWLKASKDNTQLEANSLEPSQQFKPTTFNICYWTISMLLSKEGLLNAITFFCLIQLMKRRCRHSPSEVQTEMNSTPYVSVGPQRASIYNQPRRSYAETVFLLKNWTK